MAVAPGGKNKAPQDLIENLAAESTDTAKLIRPDGAGGVEVVTFPVTSLGVGTMTDGEFLKRSGSSLVSDTVIETFTNNFGTVSGGDSPSANHGLSGTPQVVIGYVENVSGGSILGIPNGGRVNVTYAQSSGGNDLNFHVAADDTEVILHVADVSLGIVDNNGSFSQLTESNWDVIVEAVFFP